MTPKQLRKIMDTNELTPETLAAKTGMAKTTIYRYLSGDRKIPKIFCICVDFVVANGK